MQFYYFTLVLYLQGDFHTVKKLIYLFVPGLFNYAVSSSDNVALIKKWNTVRDWQLVLTKVMMILFLGDGTV